MKLDLFQRKGDCDACERLIILEQKNQDMSEKVDQLFHKIFFDNGSTSISSMVNVHDGDIKENKEAIESLRQEVKENFECIDSKLDKITDKIEQAKVFNVFHILQSILSFGTTNQGKMVRILLILIFSWITSPFVVDIVVWFNQEITEIHQKN